jgi:hypothetical protein
VKVCLYCVWARKITHPFDFHHCPFHTLCKLRRIPAHFEFSFFAERERERERGEREREE